jgi:hypothetical protein
MWLIVACIIIILALPGGGGEKAEDQASGSNTSSSLSNNEVLSRNQANLFSDVQNYFYECIGAGACVIDESEDNSTRTTNAPTTVDNRTVVTGDRNVVTMSDGRTACENPNAPGQYAPEYCE